MWYACIACPTVFGTQEELQKHYMRPSGKGCRTVFVLRNRLKRRQAHQLPADQTRRRQIWRRGIKKSAEEEASEDGSKSKKSYFCTICSATFEDEEDHKKTHEAPADGHLRDIKKLYSCAELVQNQDSREAQVKCPYCVNVLPNKFLKEHIVLMHPEVRQKLLNLIKEIESVKILSKSEDENDNEIAGPSSKSTNPPHFSKQDYESGEIPNWAAELQKLTFVSQVLYTSKPPRPNPSDQVPVTALPPETEASPRSTSSFKENGTEASGKEQPLQPHLSPLNVQVEASSSGVQTRSRSQGPSPARPAPAVISGPSQPAEPATTSQAQLPPTKKLLYHRCFFCPEKFPEEYLYLVHVMFNHTKPKTKEERKKLNEYCEILSARHEMEAKDAPISPLRKEYQYLQQDRIDRIMKQRQEVQNQAQPEAKKMRLSPKPKPVLVLGDIGDQILMDCPACSQTVPLSRRISHMEAHIDRAGLTNEPVCLICGDKTKDLMCLKEHASEHFKVKPFSCEQCWDGFSRRAILKLHMARVHGEVRKKSGKCKKRKA